MTVSRTLTILVCVAAAAGCSGSPPVGPLRVVSADEAIRIVATMTNPKTGKTFDVYARERFAKSAGCPHIASESESFGFFARQPKKRTLPWAIFFTYSGSPDPACINVALNTSRYVALVDSVTGKVKVPPRDREFLTVNWLAEFLNEGPST
jgi:hypothetical protein